VSGLSAAQVKKPGQRIMGFAAETEDLAASARAKLERKRLDWVVANDVSRKDVGFGSDRNEVTVFTSTGSLELPAMSKVKLAAELVRLVLGAEP